MADQETHQLLGRIEGVLGTVQEDVREIKSEQRVMRSQIAQNAATQSARTDLRSQAIGFGKFVASTTLAALAVLFGSGWLR